MTGVGAAVEVPDLRSVAPICYEPAQPLPAGATSLYGPDVPFGSSAFAERDAHELTPVGMTPPAEPIAGWRVAGSLWRDERFVVRVPRRWNGRLVVAGTPALRSEFACDRLLCDPLLARGYAYASGNKGQADGAVLLAPGAVFTLDGVELPRFFLPDGRGVSFWLHARGRLVEGWLDEFLALTKTARRIVADLHGRPSERIYAIGLSNGGYQVRRAIEESDAYDGALTWNAVLWTCQHNLLRHLPQAIASMEARRPEDLEALGFPADVRAASGSGSLYARNLMTYWYVTAWLHAMHLDPETSIAYGDVHEPSKAEAWNGRIASWRFDRSPTIAERVASFSNTGRIRCKLIDVAAQYDHLVVPRIHFEPYARLVASAGAADLYHAELVADAQHVDSWSDDPEYPSMRVAYPRVMAAFDEMVRWAEA